MNKPHRFLLIVPFILLAGFWLPATTLQGQSRDIYPKPQGFVLPAKQTIPVAKMYDLFDVMVDTKALKKKMEFADFFRTLHKSLPKKWQGVGFIVSSDVYGKDQELIEKIDGGWSAGWKPIDLSMVPLPQKISVRSALRLALHTWAGDNAEYRLRRGYLEIATANNASQVLNCKLGIELKGPLQEALAELSEESGVSIVLDQRLQNQAKLPVKANFNNGLLAVPLGTILDLLTDMTGLQYVVSNRVVYVTDKANAEVFEGRATQFLLAEKVAIVDLKSTYEEALEKLSAAASVSIVLDRRLEGQAKLTVKAKFFNGVPLQTALDLLTDMTNTAYVVTVGGVVYVTSPENAKAFEKSQRKKNKNAPSPFPGGF